MGGFWLKIRSAPKSAQEELATEQKQADEKPAPKYRRAGDVANFLAKPHAGERGQHSQCGKGQMLDMEGILGAKAGSERDG